MEEMVSHDYCDHLVTYWTRVMNNVAGGHEMYMYCTAWSM